MGDYHFCIHTEYHVSIIFNIIDKLFFLISKLNASNLPPSEFIFVDQLEKGLPKKMF